jgi:hypothetical protein
MLVYLSYPLMDYDRAPRWVEPFKANIVTQMEQWSCYDPMLGFAGNIENDVGLMTTLSNPKRVNALAVQAAQQLRLDPELFKPLNEVLPRLKISDQLPTTDVAFKNLYALMRSSVVVADLDNPDHGEKTQEVMYAYLIGVQVVGVAHRFMFSPYVAEKISVFVRPDPYSIVRQVLAHDHKINAMLRYYEALQAAKQSKKADQLAALQAKLEAARRQQADLGQAGKDLDEAERCLDEADRIEEQSEDGQEPRDSPV